MATSKSFAQYVCEQLRDAGEIAARRMFGEYGLYCDGKIVGLLCEDALFLKKTEAGAALAPGCPEGAPYPGAKLHFLIEDLEDRERLAELVRATFDALPAPKPRRQKGGR